MKRFYVNEYGKTDKYYDADILASHIIRRYPDIRETAEYTALEDRFFDYTQACDLQEQRQWMSHYMSKAISMERQAVALMKDRSRWNTAQGMRREAALQFIVAYDMIIA